MTHLVYLADGQELQTEVTLADNEHGTIELAGSTIPVDRLAEPYSFLGYGQLVEIAVQTGEPFSTTLQPEEYHNHYAYIQVSETEFISALYDSQAGLWRELTDAEYAQDRKAREADERDMQHIAKEWHDYAHAGDEIPPSKGIYF